MGGGGKKKRCGEEVRRRGVKKRTEIRKLMGWSGKQESRRGKGGGEDEGEGEERERK